MAINIRMNEEKVDDVEKVKVHYMPCKIQGDEEAKVSSYFETYIRKTEDDQLEGSFRGHLLNGKEMTVPEGYKGVTLSEHKKPDSETEDRSLHVTGAFSQFTYWNFDKIPSDSDALKRALDWIDIAKVLHAPLGDDENSNEPVVHLSDGE